MKAWQMPDDWRKGAVLFEIGLRNFLNTAGMGIGALPGIRLRLPLDVDEAVSAFERSLRGRAGRCTSHLGLRPASLHIPKSHGPMGAADQLEWPATSVGRHDMARRR